MNFFLIFYFRISRATIWPNSLRSRATTTPKRDRTQEVRLLSFCVGHPCVYAFGFKSFFFFVLLVCFVLNWIFVFISQRKVRRDTLASPALNERGRSRSREHAPQLIRRGSAGRGRSTSVESRRSRHSSESSLAEFEDLAKPLNSKSVKPTHSNFTDEWNLYFWGFWIIFLLNRGRKPAYNGPATVSNSVFIWFLRWTSVLSVLPLKWNVSCP